MVFDSGQGARLPDEAFECFILRGEPVGIGLHVLGIGSLGAAGDIFAFGKNA